MIARHRRFFFIARTLKTYQALSYVIDFNMLLPALHRNFIAPVFCKTKILSFAISFKHN